MADDFGDDAGDKLLEWSIRIMIERGRLHARESSAGLARALRDAQERVAPGGGAPQGGYSQAPVPTEAPAPAYTSGSTGDFEEMPLDDDLPF